MTIEQAERFEIWQLANRTSAAHLLRFTTDRSALDGRLFSWT
jgi:hypothetical protein